MDSTVGALIGLLVSIFLIIKKVSPAYSLILGALIGGLAGGFSLEEVVVSMTEGVKDVSSAVLRILTAGVLSGVLIKTGAAMTISNAIIRFWGEKRVYLALAFATMLLCAVGVFIDVAVITVAPVALSIGRRLGIPTPQLLLVMIGGGKSGNIISPNPNTIIAAENFGADLPSVMFANIIPAIIGLLFTVFVIARFFPVKPCKVHTDEEEMGNDDGFTTFVWYHRRPFGSSSGRWIVRIDMYAAMEKCIAEYRIRFTENVGDSRVVDRYRDYCRRD